MKPKPFSPKDLASANHLPAGVIIAVNELLSEKGVNPKSITIHQKDLLARIMSKMAITREEVFDKGYLNIENVFSKAGWKVVYDKPGYNESYNAYFRFTAIS